MTPRSELLLVVGMALVTFGTRYPVMALLSRRELPEAFKRALGYVPPVVLTAIIVPAALVPEGEVWVSLSNNALGAGLVAALVARQTKNTLATIVVGMAVYWLWGGLV